MLTATQRDFAGAVEEMTEALGRPPSYREVCAELDCSVSEVRRLALRLVDRGFIAAPPRGQKLKLVLSRPAPPLDETPVAITLGGLLELVAHTGKAGAT